MIVNLKNDLKATLKISENEETSSIYAFDENNNIVGFCHFACFHTYSKPAPESFRINYSKKHNIPLEQVKKVYNYKINVNKTEEYTIHENTLILTNGKSFKLDGTICQIAEIEITDDRYFQVGLGTAMLNETLKIAQKHNCKLIKGKYLPKGNYQFGTKQFYKRNGFKFENIDNETFITKDIEYTK